MSESGCKLAFISLCKTIAGNLVEATQELEVIYWMAALHQLSDTLKELDSYQTRWLLTVTSFEKYDPAEKFKKLDPVKAKPLIELEAKFLPILQKRIAYLKSTFMV